MKPRTRLATAAILAALLAVPAIAASTRFPDVSENHPRAEDIEFVAEQGWFVGRANGSFSPEARITPSQMATVLERAFPDGMTRAEFSSFLRGGNWRVGAGRPQPTTTIIPDYEFRSCEELAQAVIELSEEGETSFRARILKIYDPVQVSLTANRVECQGEALFSNAAGERTTLKFYEYADEDGDMFYGYEELR